MGLAHQQTEGGQAHGACDSKDHCLVGQDTRQFGQAFMQTGNALNLMVSVEIQTACKDAAEKATKSLAGRCKAKGLSPKDRKKCMKDARNCREDMMHNCEQPQPKDIGDIPSCKEMMPEEDVEQEKVPEEDVEQENVPEEDVEQEEVPECGDEKSTFCGTYVR